MTLTQGNVTFVLSEIMSPTLGVNDSKKDFIRLEHNPIANTIVLLSDKILPETRVDIIDLTGKIVYDKTLTINLRTPLSLQLSSGIYVINLSTKGGESMQFKLIVNQ